MEAHPVLPKMIGETITTPSPNLPDSTLYPRRDWVIIEKLSEHPRPVTPKDFDDGMGPAYTAGKYLCRLAGSRGHNKLAFMRIYKQIPLAAGTELDNSSVRKAQASKPRDHVELHALKRLTKNRCTATPKLLEYQIDKQDENDLAPGGYIIHLFWSLPYSRRESIRKKVKMACTKVSGFRRADRISPDTKWDDYNFVRFLLVLNSPARYKYLSIKAKDLKSDKTVAGSGEKED
ncbi:unnamed protein product [Penicillium egyptiacum]|uniref:Uncharacterized protein n=1 Tax=Penicillium egyptiacum TaxID=1303716 RepID=A0A9W4K2I7_9EURO|nr:unnamed protein product [Penicillium egyptiacum]